jgi:hypothetical protein
LLGATDMVAILNALAEIESDLASRPGPEPYTGEHEDLFFFVERELARRTDPDVAGRLHTDARATTSTTPCSSLPCASGSTPSRAGCSTWSRP